MAEHCACPPMYTCPVHGLKSPKKEKAKGLRRGRIAPRSEGQDARTHFIRGILAAKLRHQESEPGFPFHGYHCEDCGARIATYEEALFGFDPGHIIERTKGPAYSYRLQRTGVDDPRNIRVQCPSCNAGQHKEKSRPLWTGSSEAGE